MKLRLRVFELKLMVFDDSILGYGLVFHLKFEIRNEITFGSAFGYKLILEIFKLKL